MSTRLRSPRRTRRGCGESTCAGRTRACDASTSWDEVLSAAPVPPIITLLTDFGVVDPYVGMMKGAVLSLNPAATLVDVTHEVPPQDVATGAFLLAHAAGYF